MTRFICCVAILLTAVQIVTADELDSAALDADAPIPYTDPLQREVADLRARLAALEVRQSGLSPSAATTSQQAAFGYQEPITPTPRMYTPEPQSSGAWVGGGMLYLLAPHWSGGNPAYIISDVNNGNLDTVDVVPFNYKLQAAPGGWLGYVHTSGYGLRANYFRFDESASTSGVVTGTVRIFDPSASAITAPGNTYTASSALAINSWDLEATRAVNFRYWSWTASAGARYLYLNQTYTGGSNDVTYTSRQFFNGAGPTISLQGRRSLWDGGLGFYGNGRGALALGTTSNSMAQTGADIPIAYTSKFHSILPVTEVEFGFDYRQRLGIATFTIQSGALAQAYFDASTASGVTSAASGNFPGVVASQSSATLGMLGLRLALGLTY